LEEPEEEQDDDDVTGDRKMKGNNRFGRRVRYISIHVGYYEKNRLSVFTTITIKDYGLLT
jgi:hypothetical protein